MITPNTTTTSTTSFTQPQQTCIPLAQADNFFPGAAFAPLLRLLKNKAMGCACWDNPTSTTTTSITVTTITSSSTQPQQTCIPGATSAAFAALLRLLRKEANVALPVTAPTDAGFRRSVSTENVSPEVFVGPVTVTPTSWNSENGRWVD